MHYFQYLAGSIIWSGLFMLIGVFAGLFLCDMLGHPQNGRRHRR